jgi:hypothetical protein
MDKRTLSPAIAIVALAIAGAAFAGGMHAVDTHAVDTHAVEDAPAWSPPDADLQVLEPGDYDWHPEYAPTGDMLIVVSLPQQQLHVYRGGIRIGRSTISSGSAGRETPTGVFTILQKKVKHRSSLYDDAPMPYMQRLTWDGIAMHAGRLPGYPASHGCIRLPLEFSKLLYGATTHDSMVIVADYNSFAADIVSPGPTVSSDMLAAVAVERERELAEQQVLAAESVNAVAGIGAAQ